jgi:L-fuculose-phosphate aldolase
MSTRWFTRISLATAFSVAGTPILPIYNQAAVFAPETPIFPSPRLIYTLQDGKEICQTLGERMAMLLKGHGIVVCGDSLEYATVHAIYLERTAYMQWVASSVGTPAIMPQADIDYMKENMTYRSTTPLPTSGPITQRRSAIKIPIQFTDALIWRLSRWLNEKRE